MEQGTRIRLIFMDDTFPLPPGSEGEVTFIDDAGHIHVNWDEGRMMSLIPGVDQWEII